MNNIQALNIKVNTRILLAFITLAFTFNFTSASPATAQTNDQAVILQYHHVSSSTPAVTSTTPEAFRAHMDYLRDNNFEVLRLEDVLNSLKQGETLPDRAAVITFDDNYLTVYTEAFPILKELDWPFTIFVSTGLVGSNPQLYANWDQLKEMADAGATIANHTVTHLHLLEMLTDETKEQWRLRISNEITQAELDITENTGQSHQMLAYPYGEYNPDVQSLLNELGMIGIAQHSGPINIASDFTALPRFPFGGIYASMNSFPTKINSLAFTLELIKPLSPVTSETSPSAQIQFSDQDYRLNQLACYNNGESISVVPVEGAGRLYRIETPISNQGRRFRYNCTAPSDSGRYYWYSIHWINPEIPE